jgi:hypothetical protein
MAVHGLGPVCFESVSNVTATPSVELGEIRFYNGEYYEYVYAVKELPVGYGAVYSGTSGHSCIATGAVSGEFCAGFVKHAAISSGSYGWLLKKGVVDVKNARASTAPSVNQPAYLGSDGGFVSETPAATSAVDAGHCIGKVLSAGASGGTGASFSLLFVSVF